MTSAQTPTGDSSSAPVEFLAEAAGPAYALREAMTFRQAQALVVGLTGCAPRHAATALLVTAADLSVGIEDVLRQFDDLMRNQSSTGSHALMVHLIDAASTAADAETRRIGR